MHFWKKEAVFFLFFFIGQFTASGENAGSVRRVFTKVLKFD